MMTGVVPEQNLEKQIGKQMGCMAGFLQIFDRHQLLSGKRLYSPKRLPPMETPASEKKTEQVKTVETPAISRELEKQPQGRAAASPDRSKQSPVTSELRYPASELFTPTGNQSKSPLPLPVFEYKEVSARSPWKFSKEAPRLSLDSRAVVDAKGSLKPREIRTNASILSANQCEDEVDDSDKQRRSPSVIARLMGLEPIPDSNPEPNGKAQLRRSASEARGRDLFQYRFIDGVNFHLKQSQQPNFQNGGVSSNVVRENGAKQDRVIINRPDGLRNARAESVKAPIRGLDQRKCFYDSADFFPERKQPVNVYREIEKRLKLRGIDEPSKDLETLKQILEALQLKGLLHSKKSPNQKNNRNFVYQHEQSPIVVIKPGRSPASTARSIAKDSPPSNYRSRPGPRRNLNIDSPPTMSPRRDRPEIERNIRSQSRGKGSISPGRNECGVRSPNRRPLNVEIHRRGNGNGNVEQKRVSPVQSPRLNVRRTGLEQTTNRLPRNTKPTAEIYDKEEKVFIPAEDQTSTVSESSISTSSQTDTERSKVEDYKDGGTLLERCDKLLHSIAEMTAATTELQPSPVSVLDSSFYKEESSPSPVMKRSIDFKDQLVESEDEMWSPAIPSVESKSDDCDFIYISDVLRAANYMHDESDVFLVLEKQQYVKGKDTSKVSRLQRKLIFDTINEILNRKKQLPPWKVVTGETSLQQIWSEFQKIRERDSSDDMFEDICGVLRKDLAGDAINGWDGCPIQMSEAILDIERLIFRDLISETIRDLAALAEKSNNIPAPRRKLVF
ncbi:protein LONGIFOLIA 1 isoform X2 [Gossypium arboreum]|uniref:protein LONGIFOLIA 1 isoform X2 n=1 Tax=Gossypium arboreum TaxID=29729 RepID=UPI00081960DE|nr:protein LONGIFOLIA 1 isoform X2 [Gossypium arboreum]